MPDVQSFGMSAKSSCICKLVATQKKTGYDFCNFDCVFYVEKLAEKKKMFFFD